HWAAGYVLTVDGTHVSVSEAMLMLRSLARPGTPEAKGPPGPGVLSAGSPERRPDLTALTPRSGCPART
ncbi:hypothetical protein, partial [Nonomuraea sp. NPDC001023]|uniref:hypothetical protein n=1 Tax=Nonomuraea sp. NPDC001023 TaxID=3154770 RepID=UPI0033250455